MYGLDCTFACISCFYISHRFPPFSKNNSCLLYTSLVPSRYIEFVNRDENIDFDTKMKSLQGELKELLVQEEKSKSDLLAVFKELGYEIEL